MTIQHAPPPAATRPRTAVSRDDVIITGEAVALELRPATAADRLLSGLLDRLLYGLVAYALIFLVVAFTTNDTAIRISVIGAIVLMMVGFPVAVETLSRGQSPGKMAIGIRIVRDDGGPMRFRQALVRAVVGTAEVWLLVGAIALITVLIQRRSKRLGDLLAGTYAIREATVDNALAPLLMPPELASWARSADIRRLPDKFALYARHFLARTDSLKPQVRSAAAQQLAATVEPYVSPPPPWGTNPERFIAAVLVARRDREYRAGLSSQERESATSDRIRRLPYEVSAPV